MNATQALHVVNEIALSLLDETEPETMARSFLQRLLFHAGLPVGLLARRRAAVHGGGIVLLSALGNRDLTRLIGTSPRWLEDICSGTSASLGNLELSESAFLGASRYRMGLRLCGTGENIVVLLGASAALHTVSLVTVFEPLINRFSTAYRMSAERSRLQSALDEETARHRHFERAARENELRTRSLLELSPQALLIFDMQSRQVAFANAAMRDLLRIDKNESPSARELWARTFPDLERRRVVRAMLHERAAATLNGLNGEERFEPLCASIIGEDGATRFVEAQVHIVESRAMLALTDITERRRREEELEVIRVGAERASRAKTHFLSSVSHEIRTQLNGILGFAQILEQDLGALPTQHEHVGEILASSEHLLALVNDMLDLSRIEAGRLTVSQAPIDLDGTLRECIGVVGAQAAARRVTITLEAHESVGLIGDETRLRQVIINLLSNAVKYNVVGGKVSIAVTRQLDGCAKVAVVDTGLGIPMERRDELFRPFNRLGAERYGIEGSGLGLALAKELVELMGGQIGVESVPGQGSVFWFTLPYVAIDAVATHEPAPQRRGLADAQAARQTQILVVEDQPMNQRLICLQLEQLGGFDVVVSSNGATALELWEGGGVDIILTDCNMPVMDGYELARTIRKREAAAGTRIPIIALTASAMVEDIERCEAAGMESCLTKPVSIAQLAAALDAWRKTRTAPATRPRRRVATGATRRMDYLRAIQAMLGSDDPTDAEPLLLDFTNNTRAGMEEAAAAFERGDLEQVGHIMHRLSPSMKLVGAAALGSHAQNLEAAARRGERRVAQVVWASVKDAWAAVELDLSLPIRTAVATRADAKARGPSDQRLQTDSESEWQSELNVLVIDDDVFMRRFLRDLLRTFGIDRVQIAQDGRMALELLKDAGDFDLVLCDLAMPGMDGVELIRHLAELRFGGSIILMSAAGARVLNSVEGLAIQHGLIIAGSLVKPFEASALREIVKRRPAVGNRRTTQTQVAPVDANELRQALENGELTIHLQPKVSADTLEVVGVEVLARWFRRDGTAVPPSVFVRVAEANGLADLLFDKVLSLSLSAASHMGKAGLGGLKMAINVSAVSLARLEIAELILDRIAEFGVPSRNLVFEVTETSVVRDLKVALDVLARLRLHGIGLSIDDFGTGYSSIDLLRRVPFTELKIDRSFVANGLRDPSARHLIASSVSMAHGLGMRVVAEGVETEGELGLVRELGCDEVQGYLVARPMDETSLMRWFALREANATGQGLVRRATAGDGRDGVC